MCLVGIGRIAYFNRYQIFNISTCCAALIEWRRNLLVRKWNEQCCVLKFLKRGSSLQLGLAFVEHEIQHSFLSECACMVVMCRIYSKHLLSSWADGWLVFQISRIYRVPLRLACCAKSWTWLPFPCLVLDIYPIMIFDFFYMYGARIFMWDQGPCFFVNSCLHNLKSRMLACSCSNDWPSMIWVYGTSDISNVPIFGWKERLHVLRPIA